MAPSEIKDFRIIDDKSKNTNDSEKTVMYFRIGLNPQIPDRDAVMQTQKFTLGQ